jgi:OmpA-OmpF porin, OOP family
MRNPVRPDSLRHAFFAFVVIATTCSVSGKTATAQTRMLDLERFEPALDDSGFIGLDGTRGPPPLRFAFGAHLDLSLDPVEYAIGDESFAEITRREQLHLSAEIGILGRLSGAVRLALLHQKSDAPEFLSRNAPAAFSPFAPKSFALRDPQISLKYRFLGVSMVDDKAPKDGPGLALQIGSTLPIGTEDAWASDGRVRIDAALLADFQLLGAGAGASLGYRHRFAEAHGGGLPERNELTFAAALKAPLPPAPMIVAVLEVRGAADFKSKAGTALEVALGANLNLGDFILSLSGSVGPTDGLGTPDGRVVLGLRWMPSDNDQDSDGISDGKDQCPFLAEDPDGFNDQDGCPDPDNDNDLIPDLDDRCPTDQAEEGRDEDEDGCTDK